MYMLYVNSTWWLVYILLSSITFNAVKSPDTSYAVCVSCTKNADHPYTYIYCILHLRHCSLIGPLHTLGVLVYMFYILSVHNQCSPMRSVSVVRFLHLAVYGPFHRRRIGKQHISSSGHESCQQQLLYYQPSTRPYLALWGFPLATQGQDVRWSCLCVCLDLWTVHSKVLQHFGGASCPLLFSPLLPHSLLSPSSHPYRFLSLPPTLISFPRFPPLSLPPFIRTTSNTVYL